MKRSPKRDNGRERIILIEGASKRARVGSNDDDETERANPCYLDLLPVELLSLIANGADAQGRPILDPRCRFTLRQVSRAFYDCVSSPPDADAARLRKHGRANETWVRGRAASIGLIVERAITEGMSPEAAAALYEVPTDPHRGRAAAWMATAPVDRIVVEFMGVAMDTLPTAVDWFPIMGAFGEPEPCSVDASFPLATLRDLVRRNLLRLACSLGRMDVLDALLLWFGLNDYRTLAVAVRHAASHCDDVGIIVTLLCHVQRRNLQDWEDQESGPGDDDPFTVCRFVKIALKVASLNGRLNVMRFLCALMGWGDGSGRSRIELLGIGGDHRPRPDILDDRSVTEALLDESAWCCADDTWVRNAASADRADVFREADARGWPYDIGKALLFAIVSGSLETEEFLAQSYDVTTIALDTIGDSLLDAFCSVEKKAGVPPARAFARGMDRLRARFPALSYPHVECLADGLREHLDLAACVLDAWPSTFDVVMSWGSLQYTLAGHAVYEGHWGVLARLIVAHGRSDDALKGAANISDQDDDSDGEGSDGDEGEKEDDSERKEDEAESLWWQRVVQALIIVRFDDGSLGVKCYDHESAASRLSLLCHMAHVSGYISRSTIQAHPDAALFADVTDDHRAIDQADWARWCRPIPLHVGRKGASEVTHPERCARLAAMLDDAGLVSGPNRGHNKEQAMLAE